MIKPTLAPGAGTSAKLVSALKDKPRRGKAAAKSDLNGAHLGLPLVQSLIERHGGNLVLNKAKGKGTTAIVHLPELRILARPDAAD